MLVNIKKNITMEANSAVTVNDGETTRQVLVEGYSCAINSEDPSGDIHISKYRCGEGADELYKANRIQCRKDLADFEDAAYALQDEMIAEKNAAEVTE